MKKLIEISNNELTDLVSTFEVTSFNDIENHQEVLKRVGWTVRLIRIGNGERFVKKTFISE